MDQRRWYVSGLAGAVMVALFSVAGAGCGGSDVKPGEGDTIGVVDTGGEDVRRPDTADVAVPTCESNADCVGVFGDIGPCRVAVCGADGRCQNAAVKDYVACDDGDVCTLGSFCVQGECTGGGDVVCNDGNLCTTDRCDPVQGCVNEPQTGGACDDGDECTGEDTCQQGVCQGMVTDTCPCVTDSDCAPYEDEDLCNGTMFCDEGQCHVDPATRVVCDTSGDPACRVTACVPESGECVPGDAAAGTACDDGNGCTANDACAAGVCVGGQNLCACERDADCDDYEDGNACNGSLVCTGGACVVDPVTVVTCEQPTNACRQAVCLPATGACEDRPRADGTSCNDGDRCTTGDRCQAGACGGTPRGCDDGDACTADACDAATGQCTHEAPDCDDDDPCTSDLCDPATGVCDNVAIFCEQPENPCQMAACDPDEGGCVTQPLADGTACDDGDACTAVDVCDGGVCGGTALDCEDLDPCTTDGCDAETGECTHDAVVCPSDGDPCTLELCDQATGGCVESPAPDGTECSDGDPCTLADACDGGECEGGAPNLCDDGDLCTVDTCDPTAGCENTERDCDDAVACTVDSCDDATGQCEHDASGCPTGELCDNDVDDDQDGLTDCADTVDCAADPACEVVCAPDVLEDDDTQDAATPAAGGDGWIDLTSAFGDDDWFAIPVCAGSVLTVSASFNVERRDFGGDIDLYLWTDDGNSPASGISSGNDELIEWTADFDGTVWLQVTMFTEAACNVYHLDLELDDAGCGGAVEDCFDGADNDGDGRADCADSDCSGAISIPGECTNDADLRTAAAVDVTVIGPTCILGEEGRPGCFDDVACNTACVQDLTGLSEGCAGCGGALAACVVTQCIGDCVADPASEACADCIEANCFPAYAACFGVLHCDFEYDCEGGVDDDGDALVDCADPDCAGEPACVVPEDCDNTLDDDGDGLTDCDDVDCVADPSCVPPPPEDCDNDADDDGDGDTDCDDLDCAFDPACLPPPPEADCDNDVDDDSDGDTDCDDADCVADPACVVGPEDCDDGVDNNGDGLVDCAEPVCSGTITREGACTNPADLPIAGRVDVEALGQACIVDEGCGADVACNTTCIENATGLSPGCATCGGELAACVVTQCFGDCALDPTTPACATCIETSCYPAYVDCFGLLHCAFEYVCDNDVSDDEDALVDCADPDCAGDPACLPCQDDAVEDNDDAATATVVVPRAFFDDLVAAGGDEDWFAVAVCDGGLLVGRAVYDTAAGAVDLAIVTADGTVLAQGIGLADGRRAPWTSDRDGTVFIRVRQPDPAACLTYDLGVTLDRTNCAAPPPEDCDDGADNDGDGDVDCDDADCAAFPACIPPPPEDCFNDADDDGDSRADCLDPDCSAAIAAEGACTNDVDLPIAGRVDIQALGRYCILTEGCSDATTCTTCVQEQTGVSTDCATCGGELAACVVSTCFAECGGPDEAACAACIEASCWPAYVTCFGLLHCTFEMACGDGTDDDDDGDLDCADADCVDQPPCVPAAERCGDSVDNDGDGAVDCADPDCAADPFCLFGCLDDALEDNETQGDALSQVAPFAFTGLVSASGDDDWFEIPVCNGAELTITATFSHAGGDIDIYLRDAAGDELDSSTGATDDEQIVWTAPFEGSVFLQVNMWDQPDRCNTYDLAVEYDPSACVVVEPEICDDTIDNDQDGDVDCFDVDCFGDPACGAAACGGDDAQEPNDDLAGAMILPGDASFTGLVVALDNEDWFRVPVCDGGELTVDVTFLHALGDIDVELTDAAGARLDISQSTNDDEQIVWPSDLDGPVFVRVYFFPNPDIGTVCNTYDLDIVFDATGCAAPPEDCFDGADNDGDGRPDCQDPDCSMTVSAPGNCTNPTDLRAIAGVDIVDVAYTCILGSAGQPGCFTSVPCNTDCVARLVGVSPECAGCGGEAAVCAANRCAIDCTLDPNPAACDTCLAENCWPAYTECFGTLKCGFEEDCTDGLDDDGDGEIDCADLDCIGVAGCR